MSLSLTLRLEQPADHRAVEELTREAFWNQHMPGCDEHYILHVLRGDPAFLPELSFVALQKGRLVGHIAYSRSTVTDAQGVCHPVVTFGPVSVLPDCQRNGVGSALVSHTLALARETGHRAVFIYGDPRYYCRFGFRPAERFGVTASDGSFAVALLGLPLQKDGLAGVTGRFSEVACFSADPVGFAAFDAAFPPKEKGYRISQTEFSVLSTLRYRG